MKADENHQSDEDRNWVRRVRESMPADESVDDVADVFSLLGDPGRVRILSALLVSRLRVRDIASVTGLSESAVSHALHLLRAHRVVKVERTGREAHYELDDSHVGALLHLALDHVGHSVMLHVPASEGRVDADHRHHRPEDSR
ncbi:MAG: metalloregulator ArsR/SmtB family transcription factor [Rhodoglobus sp.]